MLPKMSDLSQKENQKSPKKKSKKYFEKKSSQNQRNKVLLEKNPTLSFIISGDTLDPLTMYNYIMQCHSREGGNYGLRKMDIG